MDSEKEFNDRVDRMIVKAGGLHATIDRLTAELAAAKSELEAERYKGFDFAARRCEELAAAKEREAGLRRYEDIRAVALSEIWAYVKDGERVNTLEGILDWCVGSIAALPDSDTKN